MNKRVMICGINTSNLPKLSYEEANNLLLKIKAGDSEAKNYFIYCNMRLVLSISQRFVCSKESMDDIFQVGCVGLMKAIDNFDLSVNVKFSTYAVPMIIGEIKRFLRDSSTMRVSRSLRDTAYQVLKCRERLSNEMVDDVSIEDIASDLNLTIREVTEAIDAVSEPASLDEAVFNDGDENVRLIEHIADEKQACEKWMNHMDLLEAVKTLEKREREILNLRYFVGKTQIEVSDKIGISQAQVSRLEKNALDTIKKFMQI